MHFQKKRQHHNETEGGSEPQSSTLGLLRGKIHSVPLEEDIGHRRSRAARLRLLLLLLRGPRRGFHVPRLRVESLRGSQNVGGADGREGGLHEVAQVEERGGEVLAVAAAVEAQEADVAVEQEDGVLEADALALRAVAEVEREGALCVVQLAHDVVADVRPRTEHLQRIPQRRVRQHGQEAQEVGGEAVGGRQVVVHEAAGAGQLLVGVGQREADDGEQVGVGVGAADREDGGQPPGQLQAAADDLDPKLVEVLPEEGRSSKEGGK